MSAVSLSQSPPYLYAYKGDLCEFLEVSNDERFILHVISILLLVLSSENFDLNVDCIDLFLGFFLLLQKLFPGCRRWLLG